MNLALSNTAAPDSHGPDGPPPSPVLAAVQSALRRRLPVFLDSATASSLDQAVSIVACDPSDRIEGRLPDTGELSALYGTLRTAGAPGALIGAFDYEGAWSFAYYPHAAVFDHAASRWAIPPAWPLSQGPPPGPCTFAEPFQSAVSAGAYCAWVRHAQEHIAAGDIYQVNLAHRFTARFSGSPYDYYRALRTVSPAPFCAFLDQGNRQIASSSPECFLRMSGRNILTCPIKGTRPRGRTALEDARLISELQHSPKERAELLMITDLERNDLGRVCEIGSIKVRELFGLRLHPQVIHLVSAVAGVLRPDVDHVNALAACFPGGSITGAPKIRAMEIITDIERSPRGLYTGAIGCFGLDGANPESRFSIAIRTVIFENGLAHFHTGAGIVADSSPQAEYEETLVKASGMLLAARQQFLHSPA